MRILFLIIFWICFTMPMIFVQAEDAVVADNLLDIINETPDPFVSKVPPPPVEVPVVIPEGNANNANNANNATMNQGQQNFSTGSSSFNGANQTQSAPEPVVTLPDLEVSGMLWNSHKPQAIINDVVVSVGDDIEGVEIVAIEKSGIKLKFNGKSYNLQMD